MKYEFKQTGNKYSLCKGVRIVLYGFSEKTAKFFNKRMTPDILISAYPNGINTIMAKEAKE